MPCPPTLDPQEKFSKLRVVSCSRGSGQAAYWIAVEKHTGNETGLACGVLKGLSVTENIALHVMEMCVAVFRGGSTGDLRAFL